MADTLDLNTIVETLSDDEKKKNLTLIDFVNMYNVLDIEEENNNAQPASPEKVRKINKLQNNRSQLLLAANDYVKHLANSDLSKFSATELDSCIKSLERLNLKTTNSAGDAVVFLSDDARTLVQNIQAQQTILKDQSLNSINNHPENLSPADLWSLRENLKHLPQDPDITDAGKQLEDIIVTKANDVAEGKTIILDINQGYILQNLLQDVHEHPLSDKAQENKAIVEKAQQQLKDIIDTFEEQYGVGKHLLNEEIVKRNLATLETMPSDEVLFSYNQPESKLSPEIDFESIRGAYTDAQKKGEMFDLARLAGVLQYKHLDLPQYDEVRKNLLEMALKQVKETDINKLETKDFANFEMLLQKLQASDKNDDKKTAKLLSEKQDALTSRKKTRENIKYPEFASVMNVLDNLQVEGDVTFFGREKISQNGADSDVNLFKERIRQRTEIFLANTSQDEITEEAFRDAYSEQLKLGIVEVVYADKISKGNLSKKDMLNMFDELDKAAAKGKPIRINQASFVGWQTIQDNRCNAAAGRMEAQGQNSTSKTWFGRIRECDSKYIKKYPNLYPLLKTAVVSGGWGTLYGIGSTFGPAGVACVATASFAYSGYKFFRTYKEARKQAKAKGEKLGFWKFIKNNKLQTAGFALSAASAAFGISSAVQAASAGVAWAQEGLGLATQNSSLAATFQLARTKAGYLLAATGAIDRARKAYQKQDENDTRSIGKRRWDAVKAFGLSALSFGAGMYAGRTAGSFANQYFSHHDVQDAHTETNTLEETESTTVQPVTQEMPTLEEPLDKEIKHPEISHTIKGGTSQPIQSPEQVEEQDTPRRIIPLSDENLKPKIPSIEISMPSPEDLKIDFEGQRAHNLGVQTIERLDNGNISVERISPEGRHYHSVVSPDGKFVSLTVEEKDFPQDRLDYINNPEKGTISPILDQNKQLFMLAPAIGEDIKDFTVSSTNSDEISDSSASNLTDNKTNENSTSDNNKDTQTTSETAEKINKVADTQTVSKNVEDTTETVDKKNQELSEDDGEKKTEPSTNTERPKTSKPTIDDIPAVTDQPISEAETDDSEHKDKNGHDTDDVTPEGTLGTSENIEDESRYTEPKPSEQPRTEEANGQSAFTQNPETPIPSSLDEAKNKFLDDIQDNHGLEQFKVTSNNSLEFRNNHGHGYTLAMFGEADNGYAETSQTGANVFVINDGTGHFQTGEGDNIRPMNYDEAKEFSDTILKFDTTIDSGSIQKFMSISGALYALDPQAFAQDAATAQGISVNESSQIIHKEAGTLIISDNGISIATNDGEIIGCALDKNGEIKGFKGMYGTILPSTDDQQLKTLATIVSSYEQGDSQIGKILGEKTGVNMISEPSHSEQKLTMADKVNTLRGTDNQNPSTPHSVSKQTPVHVASAPAAAKISTR